MYFSSLRVFTLYTLYESVKLNCMYRDSSETWRMSVMRDEERWSLRKWREVRVGAKEPFIVVLCEGRRRYYT